MHDCPCCSDIIYCDDLLCDDCQEAGCECNKEGAYDSCERVSEYEDEDMDMEDSI